MPAQPYALTDRQAAVLEVLSMNHEWTAAELTGEGIEVFCDPCDGTDEGLLSRREVCPICHGHGWRWLCHIEVEQTLSVQFKSTSGSVTTKERRLSVWTMGF